MKVLILLFAGILASTSVLAQNRTYTVEPSTVVTETTTVLDEITKYYVHFKNTTGDDIQIGWKKLSMDIPSGWDYSLCDLGTCYSGIPDGEFIMSTVHKDSSGFLAPNLFPDNISGTFSLRIAVWDVNNPTISDTITWIITATTQSAVKPTVSVAPAISLFPNPASTAIQIDFAKPENGLLRIVSIAGTIQSEINIIGQQTAIINIADLISGDYLLVFTTKEGLVSSYPFIKR